MKYISVVQIWSSLFVLVACGSAQTPQASQPDPSPRGPDFYRQYTVRWVDNGALDLMSPPATFIRAFVESMDRAAFAPGRGMNAIESGGFPGFAHAFNRALDPDIVGGVVDTGNRLIGTDFLEVIDVRRDGDQYRVVYCDYRSLVSFQKQDGKWAGIGATPLSSASRLTFGPDPAVPPDQQHLPKGDQRGPAQVASDTVFGTWVAVPGSATMDREAADEWYPKCGKLAPGTPADWPSNDRPPSDPPPTLPPSPGWPSSQMN